MDDVFTVQGAADHTKLSVTTIYRALERGELVGSKVGTAWRIFATDLEAWLIAQRPVPAEPRPQRRRPRPRHQRGSLRALRAKKEQEEEDE